MKECSKCKNEKDDSEFHKQQGGYLQSNCKECHKRYAREWYRNNTKEVLLSNSRTRAKKFGLEFNIVLDDIIIPEVCPILEIPIFIGTEKMCENSPTLDRIDNSKGYIKGNVRVISALANMMKRDASLEELVKFSRNIVGYIYQM